MIRPAYHTEVRGIKAEIARVLRTFVILCTFMGAVSFPTIAASNEEVTTTADPSAQVASESVIALSLGTHPDALLYRPQWETAEGVVYVAGGERAGTSLVAEWLNEGMTVLVLEAELPAEATLAWARAAFSTLQARLGAGSEVAVVGVGAGAAVALRVAQEREAGASLLIDPQSPLSPTRSTPALVLVDEAKVTAIEYGRDLYLDSEDRGELWLIDLSGAKWSELLSRSDLAIDLANWTREALDRTRARRTLPVAGGNQ